MTDYARLLDRGTAVASDEPELAVVPLVAGLLAVGNVETVIGFDGFHVGLKFPFPSPILTVWSFVSLPSQGVSGPSAVPLLALPLLAVTHGLLAAGYLGRIHAVLVGRSTSFVGDVGRYAAPMVGFQLLLVGAVLALVVPLLVSPLLFVFVVPVLLVAGYCFYAAPYLVVAADEPLVDALVHSYELATDGGAYLGFFWRFLVGGTAVSIVATAAVVNLGLVGVALGVVLAAPLAVALNAATMALAEQLVEDDGDGPRGRPDDDRLPAGDRPSWKHDVYVPPSDDPPRGADGSPSRTGSDDRSSRSRDDDHRPDED